MEFRRVLFRSLIFSLEHSPSLDTGVPFVMRKQYGCCVALSYSVMPFGFSDVPTFNFSVSIYFTTNFPFSSSDQDPEADIIERTLARSPSPKSMKRPVLISPVSWSMAQGGVVLAPSKYA